MMQTEQDTLDRLVEQVHASYGKSCLTTLPPTSYYSTDYFNLEHKQVLSSGWHAVCRVDQIAEPGTYLPVDLLGTPLVITRDKENMLHVLSRVCRHRWMDVTACTSGKDSTLRCPYHRWTYELDGTLLAAPLMGDDFPKEENALDTFRHEVWNGFVFANLDGDAPHLATQLAPLDGLLANYDTAGYQTVDVSDWSLLSDWKIVVENFIECYHHMGTHADTLGKDFPATQASPSLSSSAFTTVVSGRRLRTASDHAPETSLPGSPRLTQEEQDVMLIIAIFPQFVMSITPGSIVWLQINPTGAGKTDLKMHVCMSEAAIASPQREILEKELIADVMTVFEEDVQMCAGVQRSLVAPGVKPGRLAPLEYPLSDFYRYISHQLNKKNNN